jgi:acyl-coenzyme A synthetase/AMP-(fatty) acid ligase
MLKMLNAFSSLVMCLNTLSSGPVEGNDAKGVLVIDRPWPGIARTMYRQLLQFTFLNHNVYVRIVRCSRYGDHQRFMSTYMSAYKGSVIELARIILSFVISGAYFTGDGATRDKDGFYWITGRVDGSYTTFTKIIIRITIIVINNKKEKKKKKK